MLRALLSRPTPANDPRLAAWLPTVSPSFRWDWPHIVHVRRQLDMVTGGVLKKLMMFLPPRHGKTELVTIRYPVFRLEMNPTARIIVGSYNQTLANKFSRRARRIAQTRFPLSAERTAVEDWETAQGGGVRAVGVGAGITGQGSDCIIIDDPVKSREEAESQAYRDRVWDWYTNDLYTRQEPGCAIVITLTRWHKDDLAGRILESEDGPNWTVVNLPAEAEEDDPLGRAVGEALCPDRFDLAKLADIKRVLGRDYFALYQQRPQAREGGMFKEHWLTLCDAIPAEAQRIRWWDRAATANGGDYSAGVLVAHHDGIFYVEDVMRGQWSSGERDKIIRSTAEADRLRYAPVYADRSIGVNPVEYWGEQEPGSSGKDAALAFIRLLAGFEVHTEPTTGSKESALRPLAAQAEAGNVKVKRAPWTASFISEACDFPDSKNDDQIESAGRAFNKIALDAGMPAFF